MRFIRLKRLPTYRGVAGFSIVAESTVKGGFTKLGYCYFSERSPEFRYVVYNGALLGEELRNGAIIRSKFLYKQFSRIGSVL